MTLLFWLLMSLNAKALNLEVVDVQYRLPPQGASCGLLHQREIERLKVIRELAHLTRKMKDHRSAQEAMAEYRHWLKKLFMPRQDWAEESTEIAITLRPPQELIEQWKQHGPSTLFLVTTGPGFVWQSFADQLPPNMSISLTAENLLEVRYLTYLNAVCDPDLTPVEIGWVQTE